MSEKRDITKLLREAVERFDSLSPLERAIALIEQKRSFVRGMRADDTSVEAIERHLDTEPEWLLLQAYREALVRIDRIETRLGKAIELITAIAGDLNDGALHPPYGHVARARRFLAEIESK